MKFSAVWQKIAIARKWKWPQPHPPPWSIRTEITVIPLLDHGVELTKKFWVKLEDQGYSSCSYDTEWASTNCIKIFGILQHFSRILKEEWKIDFVQWTIDKSDKRVRLFEHKLKFFLASLPLLNQTRLLISSCTLSNVNFSIPKQSLLHV